MPLRPARLLCLVRPFTRLLCFAAQLAVDAAFRIREHLNLEHIQIIKKAGGSMRDSYLDDVRARAPGLPCLPPSPLVGICYAQALVLCSYVFLSS